MNDFAASARLFYLANELRTPLPASLLKYLPQGELLQAIASFGLAGAESGLGLSRAQLEKLMKQGSKDGKPTREEWRYLATHLITETLIDQKETMKTEDFMQKMNLLSRWSNGASSLVEVGEGGFTNDGVNIEKWDSGFSPFDIVMEGFYTGLFIIMGSTGTGKTSHMLSLAESLRRKKLASEIWFFQTEIPQPMFKYRMKPMTERTKFLMGKDRIFYGLQPISEIIEMVKSHPDPNRVIFHDSPDVLAGGSVEDGRRFELESIFRDLVILKSLCKSVFAASQVRRKDRSIKITSAAEAWAKAWYADGMLGIQKLGFRNEMAHMKASVVKNRFGPVDFEIQYEYDQVNLLGSLNGKSKKRASGWEEEAEEAEGDDW